MGISTLQTLAITAEGLSAQRDRMNAAAENIAHADTTRTPEGGPYRRKRVVFSASSAPAQFSSQLAAARLSLRRTRDEHHAAIQSGPLPGYGEAAAITANTVTAPPEDVKMVYDPTHPDANEDGYVAMPDVEIMTEMVDLMSASRAYEANLTVADAVKTSIDRALTI